MTDWGSHTWYAMTATAYAYPVHTPTDEQKKHYTAYYANLVYTLPCKKCRRHWAEFIHQHPPDVRSRRSLTQWIYHAHNTINQHAGKDISRAPSLEEVDRRFHAVKSTAST